MLRQTRSPWFILAFAAGVLSSSVHAQFTYLGAEFGYSIQQLNGEGRPNNVETLAMKFSAIHRPWRQVGFGISYPIRLSQNADYTPFGLDGYGGWGDGYKPTVTNTIAITQEFSAFLRVFADTRTNVFFDLRLRSYLLEQSFSLVRNYRPPEYYDGEIWYAEIPARSAYFASASRSLAPGFSVGVSPHLGKHGFFSFQFELDLVQFDARELSMVIEADAGFQETWYDYKTIRVDLNEMELVWSVGVGGGIFF
jgi:hypothetical protein